MNAYCLDKTEQCADFGYILPLTKRQTDRQENGENVCALICFLNAGSHLCFGF